MAQNDQSAVDGKCIIDIVLKDRISMAKATMQDLSQAANGLLNRCVIPQRVGGIAMDIGKALRSMI